MKRILLVLCLMALPVFGAPSIVAQAATSVDVAASSASAPIPAGAAGERILIVASTSSASPPTVPSGYSLLLNQSSRTFGTKCNISLLEREADGSEGASVALNYPGSVLMEVLTVRIAGHDSSTPTAFAFTRNLITNAPNPPSLNPAAWDVEDTLWIAVMCAENSATTPGFPVNYSNDQYAISGTPALGFASRLSTAASEDPGAFSIFTAKSWLALTLAIRPAP